MFAPPHAGGAGGIAVAGIDIAIRVAADYTEGADTVVGVRVAVDDSAGLPAAKGAH